MLSALLTMFLGPIEQPARIDDPLLAAGAAVLAARPDLASPSGRPTASGRLALVRIVHVADMIHVGEHGTSFLADACEATTLGPLHPRLYAAAGGRAMREPARFLPLRADAARCLDQACDLASGMTRAGLGAFVHREPSAWNERYRPGRATERGPVIRVADLAAEYGRRRLAAATAA